MGPPTLLLDQSDHILTLTLNQPAKLNPLDLPQWDELAHPFSAGADIRGMSERRDAAQQIAHLDNIWIPLARARLPAPTAGVL